MNVQLSLIWELIFYELEPGHYAEEVIKSIFCTKVKGKEVRPSTIGQGQVGLKPWIPKYLRQILNYQASLASQFTVVLNLHDHRENMLSCRIVLLVTKISQKFWLTQIF